MSTATDEKRSEMSYTVYGVIKNPEREDSRIPTPKPGAINVSLEEADDYALRNESPDNSERYIVRDDETGLFHRPRRRSK